MGELSSKPGYRAVYQLLAACYGFLVVLAVMLLERVSAGVAFLSLQCISLVFTVPLYLCLRPQGAGWSNRLLRQLRSFLYPCGILASGMVAALLSSFVTPVPAGRILLATLFAAAFGLFLAGVCSGARALTGRTPAQALTLGIGLLMVSTPYYVNPFIRAASGALRMRVVQTAVNVNPLLVGAAGVLKFDWLRAPHLYQTCLVGGYQYPFYYPSATKIGIIFSAVGIILIAVSAFRKAGREGESHE
jgi:hypothetical protein